VLSSSALITAKRMEIKQKKHKEEASRGNSVADDTTGDSNGDSDNSKAKKTPSSKTKHGQKVKIK
jgi:hypothetical protein